MPGRGVGEVEIAGMRGECKRQRDDAASQDVDRSVAADSRAGRLFLSTLAVLSIGSARSRTTPRMVASVPPCALAEAKRLAAADEPRDRMVGRPHSRPIPCDRRDRLVAPGTAVLEPAAL